MAQFAIGWYNDYASCRRQVPVRNALRRLGDVERKAQQHTSDAISKQLRGAAANALNVSGVDCGELLPDVK